MSSPHPGFSQHPKNPRAFVAIDRPNPEEKLKVRQLENQVAQLQSVVEKLLAQKSSEGEDKAQ